MTFCLVKTAENTALVVQEILAGLRTKDINNNIGFNIMTKLRFSILFLLLFGGFTTISMAQETEQGAPQAIDQKKQMHRIARRMHMKMLQEVDSNKDGQIDLNEYLAHAENRFQKMDLDQNGFISKDEQREFAKSMREQIKERRQKWREKRNSHAPEADSTSDGQAN